MSQQKQKKFQLADEISSSVTHALGGYLGSAALVLLVVFAVQSGTHVPWKIVSGVIFASTVIILYSASTLYHAVTNARIKEICRDYDQMAIYALIAGTYTPLCLVTLRPAYPVLSWTVFVTIWTLTLAGIVFKILFARRKLRPGWKNLARSGDRAQCNVAEEAAARAGEAESYRSNFIRGLQKYVTTLTYLAMGWFGLVLILPLWDILAPMGIFWIVLGGLLYSTGVGFYLLKIMPFHHTVWHIFVLGGTICHFFAILFYVMMA